MADVKKPNKLRQLIEEKAAIELLNPKTDGNENMSYDTDEDEYGNEIIGRRAVLVGGKVTYHLQATDPYGHWKVTASRGRLPEELSGSYTSAMAAQRAIDIYTERANAASTRK